ncbi:LVIVD repeat-containing protein [Halosegnis rubeus]|nr:hypothetical protein [Halosegnis rubeus]
MTRPSMTRRTVLSALGVAAAAGVTGVGPATATRQQALEPTHTVEAPGTREVTMADDGVHAFIAVGDGIVVVDTDAGEVVARRRELLADRESGPISSYADCVYNDGVLALAGRINGPGDALNGIVVFDVSDPTSPTQQRFIPTDHGIHNAAVSGTTVYATAAGIAPDSPIIAYDATDGTELGRWSVIDAGDGWSDVWQYYRISHDIYADGDTLYTSQWDAGTWRIDASDPAAMTAEGKIGGLSQSELAERETGNTTQYVEMPANHHVAAPHPDRPLVAVGHEAFDSPETETSGAPAGITVWDISDMENPRRVQSLAPPVLEDNRRSTAHNIRWRGDRLYASFYYGGAKVYDLSDVTDPQVVGEYRQPDEAQFWAAVPNEGGFVASSMGGQTSGGESFPAQLYVFPEPSGEETAPAELGAWPGNTNSTVNQVSTLTPTPTPTPTATPEPTATQTAEPTATETATATESATETSGSQPGFGVLAALAGGVVGASRLLRGEESE